jgi:release factor glutamine methyltransferase
MNVNKALQQAAQMLDVVSDSARLDAELLLMFVLGEPRSHLFAHPDRELTPGELDQFMQLTGRRASRESIAYLTGEKEFWSMPLKVTPDTLVPRPETELLVEEALRLIPVVSGIRVLDLGTGSGAIAIAIASERPRCRVVATDISPAAIAIATENASRHQLNNVAFRQGNWLEAVGALVFDLIVSNPPYIASGDAAMNELSHEPRDALVSGVDGLDSIRRIAADAGGHLATGGALLIEHGADQALAVTTILEDHGWRDLRCLPDLSGLPRVTTCICPIRIGSTATSQV